MTERLYNDYPECYDCNMILMDHDLKNHKGHQVGAQVNWSKLEQVESNLPRDFKLENANPELFKKMKEEHAKAMKDLLGED